jgi:hypothetical protein
MREVRQARADSGQAKIYRRLVAGGSKNMKTTKKLKPGVPMRLDDKTLNRVPAPKPTRAQIIEALVTLKIEQVQAERKVWDDETEQLRLHALALLQDEVESTPTKQFKMGGLPSCYDGKTLNSVTLSFDGDKLSRETRTAILEHAKRDKDDAPRIPGASRHADEGEVRRAARKLITGQLAVQEGTHRDRLTPSAPGA